MVEIIQLEAFKRKKAATRGFKSWLKRFGEQLDEKTRVSDLSDNALAFLISPGEQNIFALYELVMGVKNLGSASDFFQLEKAEKMEVIDISVHLLDQLRFESMRRLSWLANGTEPPMPIVEMIEQHSRSEKRGVVPVPPLRSSHPDYETFEKLSDFERETFVRKQIPAAIEQFKRKLKDD